MSRSYLRCRGAAYAAATQFFSRKEPKAGKPELVRTSRPNAFLDAKDRFTENGKPFFKRNFGLMSDPFIIIAVWGMKLPISECLHKGKTGI